MAGDDAAAAAAWSWCGDLRRLLGGGDAPGARLRRLLRGGGHRHDRLQVHDQEGGGRRGAPRAARRRRQRERQLDAALDQRAAPGPAAALRGDDLGGRAGVGGVVGGLHDGEGRGHDRGATAGPGHHHLGGPGRRRRAEEGEAAAVRGCRQRRPEVPEVERELQPQPARARQRAPAALHVHGDGPGGGRHRARLQQPLLPGRRRRPGLRPSAVLADVLAGVLVAVFPGDIVVLGRDLVRVHVLPDVPDVRVYAVGVPHAVPGRGAGAPRRPADRVAGRGRQGDDAGGGGGVRDRQRQRDALLDELVLNAKRNGTWPSLLLLSGGSRRPVRGLALGPCTFTAAHVH